MSIAFRSVRTQLTMIVYLLGMLALTTLVLAYLRGPSGNALIWPVNAIAVVVLKRQPPRLWPIWLTLTAAALLLANLFVANTPWLAVSLTGVDLVEITLVAFMIRRSGADPRTLPGYFVMIAIAFAGASISTPVAALVLWSATGSLSAETALYWFAASVMGLILLVPALTAVRRDRPDRVGRMLPCILLLPVPIALISTGVFVFGDYPVLFLLMPCGVFAAFRFRFAGAGISTLTIAIVATVFTIRGTGPIAVAAEDLEGRLLFLQAFLTAITLTVFPVATLLHQRLKTLATIRSAERQLRLLTDHSTDMIVRIDLDGVYRYASPAAERLLGYSVDALIGESAFLRVHPDDRFRVIRGARRLTHHGGELVLSYRLQHRVGHYVWMEGAFRLATDMCGVAEVVGTVRDVGARQAAEHAAALAHSRLEDERMLLSMAESVAHIGHWRINVADNTVFWSPELFRIHGIEPRANVTLEDAMKCYHPDDRAAVAHCVQSAIDNRTGYHFHARVLRPDGEIRWVMSRGQIEWMPGAMVEGVFGVLQDVTEQMSAIAESRAAREAAERALDAKAVFTATISHEIRTPLTSILATATLLRRTPDYAERMRHLDTLEQAGRTLATIVDDVLTFSKLEGGHAEREAVAFDLRAIATTVAEMFAAEATAHGVTIEIDVPAARRVGDPVAIQRVLTNLVSNAVRFTRDGRVQIRAEDIGDDRWQFDVCDRGVGIRPDRLSAVFEPFVQADVSTTRRYGGTGLGLSICRMLVDAMGGMIEVKSRPGEGSRFRFVLSLPPVPATTAVPVRRQATPVGRSLTVLVAEDNATNRYLISELVRQLGHHVVEVENGARAVEYVTDPAGHPLDLVLMDVQMPVMDGIAAARSIRASGGGAAIVPIHALTAYVSVKRRTEIADAGIDGVLAKPVELTRLRELLDGIQSADDARMPPIAPVPAIDRARVRALGDTLGGAGRDTLLSLLIEDARRVPTRLRELVAERRTDLARYEAHGLRGAAASVGAIGLMTVLNAIETGDRGTPIDPDLLDELDRFAQDVIDAVRSVMAASDEVAEA
ncbi:ATP-binding protein [Sphingomonas sp. CFBP 13720]|uniref:ATP-binding protein n=1 Tax=Sphingomonas sp. CFBP 13720 TaxID=2775302 RepID=UPI001780B3B7|nr:ATP-binding protein [Sphingomonas sp. CFBP 13720]MBD8677606.1 PAS domain-containing protein [Sphingomonas sp. CFBP 13720]